MSAPLLDSPLRSLSLALLAGLALSACSDDPAAMGSTGLNGTTAGTGVPTTGMSPGVTTGDGGTTTTTTTGDGGIATMTGDGGTTGGDAATTQPPAPMYEDPGADPWELVPEDEVAERCGLDPELLAEADASLGVNYAIVRYGELCHERIGGFGGDTAGEVWSATKTLAALVTGIASYETRDFQETGPMTGQLLDTDLATHWLGSVSYNDDATLAHVLAMIGHNGDLSYGERSYTYDTVGTTQINSVSDMVNAAIAQDSARLGANIEEFTQKFLYDAIGMTNSTWTGGASNKNYAYTWSTTLHDMARVGLLILHQGLWNGERVLDQSWTYKMTHPAFEDANTAYGYLTWLNARDGGTGPGGAFGGTSGDPCAPPALWPSYPHGLSEAPDCLYDSYSCDQMHDVGVWSAQGLGGQFIVGHPALDLVIVAKNFGGGGPTGLWDAIRPALVALDPTYAGDEDAFCEDYASSRYAPDLMTPPMAP